MCPSVPPKHQKVHITALPCFDKKKQYTYHPLHVGVRIKVLCMGPFVHNFIQILAHAHLHRKKTAGILPFWLMIIGCIVLQNIFYVQFQKENWSTNQSNTFCRLDNLVEILVFGTESREGQKTFCIWPVQRSAVWSRARERASLQDSLHEPHRPHNLLYLYFTLLFVYCFERCIFTLCVPGTDVKSICYVL